jgi:hypothetical protein
MPLARYFLFVGAALLVLLFIADEYLPKLPVAVAERTDAAADLSVIRIHSDRKWPERVVFDTTVPPITPAATATVEANASTPANVTDVSAKVADVSAKVRVREVFAQLPLSYQLQPADPRKPEPKPQSKRKTMARSRIAPPMMLVAQQPRVMLVAQQPRVGLFGNTVW